VRRIESVDCGIAVEPQDKAALLAACTRLIQDAALRARLGANGRRAAETLYNRDHVADRLDKFLRGLLRVNA
jgi:glycosyltransferase involved in cell wall biosynthesis